LGLNESAPRQKEGIRSRQYLAIHEGPGALLAPGGFGVTHRVLAAIWCCVQSVDITRGRATPGAGRNGRGCNAFHELREPKFGDVKIANAQGDRISLPSREMPLAATPDLCNTA
jgi:hypothetical protein